MKIRPILFLVALVALVACNSATAANHSRGRACGHNVRYGFGGPYGLPYGGLGLVPLYPGLVYQEPPRRSPVFERIWADYRSPTQQAAPVAVKGYVDRMPDYTPNPKMIENPFYKK